MSKKVCKTWTRSSTETVEISHLWTVEKFSLRNEKVLFSSIFSSPQDVNKRKWRMNLYPNGETEVDKGYLSLYLNLKNPTEEEIEVNRWFSLNDENGKCLRLSRKNNKTFSKTAYSWGCPKLIKRDELLSMLTNDTLHITYNLSYINVVKTISGTGEESPLQAQEEQPVSCNLIENLGAMLINNDFSDVTLSVGVEEIMTDFRAHKAILAARSPYFEAMFSHDFREKAENRVEIRDVKPGVFKEILTYIYTGKVNPQNMNENDAKELLVAADRFDLEKLKTVAENFLVSKINVENALELLVLGHVHSAENVKTKATDFVATNVKQIKQTEGWEMMIRQHQELTVPILDAVTGKL